MDTDTGSIRAQLILPKSIPGIKLKAGTAPWTDNWTIEGLVRTLPYKNAALPLPDLGDGEEETPVPGLTTPSGGVTSDTPPPVVEEPTPAPAEPTPGTGW